MTRPIDQLYIMLTYTTTWPQAITIFMRSILGISLVCLVTISVHSQDIESKVFINEYFGKSTKLVYAEKVGEYAIEKMKDALIQDTLCALGAKFSEPNRRLILTQQERSYIQEELQLQSKEGWNNHLFENGTMLTKSAIDSIYSDRTMGWTYFEEHYGSRLYRFSRPIFIRDYSLCIFYSGYTCGYLCGQGQLMIFEKKNGQWVHWMDLYKWVS